MSIDKKKLKGAAYRLAAEAVDLWTDDEEITDAIDDWGVLDVGASARKARIVRREAIRFVGDEMEKIEQELRTRASKLLGEKVKKTPQGCADGSCERESDEESP